MNYRHAFHAGNFADVFKHAVLALLLRALAAKEKPLRYIETHAGAGRYNLESAAARKTGEWRDGIARLWDSPAIPAELGDYLDAVRALNPGGRLRFYPGSPLVARHFLRAHDRMALMELVPEECAALAAEFATDKRVRVRCEDGYAGLRALLPPPERRALVLIDPPYERAAEFDDAVRALKDAQRRFAAGVYAVWYPIKDRPPIARFHRALAESGMRKILCVELVPFPEDTAFRLNGGGLVLVNPPWPLERTVRDLLPQLLELLRTPPAAGRTDVTWLVPE